MEARERGVRMETQSPAADRVSRREMREKERVRVRELLTQSHTLCQETFNFVVTCCRTCASLHLSMQLRAAAHQQQQRD